MMNTRDVDEDELQRAIEERFQCARCGHCCKGDGIVRFGSAEAERMAEALGLARASFLKTFAIRFDPRTWVLHDKMVRVVGGAESEKWCVFLERGPDGFYGCRVNGAKPDQCGAFPAKWRNLDSVETCVGLRALRSALRREKEAAPSK